MQDKGIVITDLLQGPSRPAGGGVGSPSKLWTV